MSNRDSGNRDHWDEFAEAMDLTIEGHRLIAQEIAYELRLLWRGVRGRLRYLGYPATRPDALPPA